MSETHPSFHFEKYPAQRLVKAKGSRTVSVVLPARNEARTVGAIVSAITDELMGAQPIVDELIVLDDSSTDGTAEVARRAGATVVGAAEVAPELELGNGKGEALWKSLLVTKGDIICWCDADVTTFSPGYVMGLVGPLLENEELVLTKGWYERPVRDGAGGQAGPAAVSRGGRVTELTARPLIALLAPHLAHFVQPLSGEFAAVRHAVENVPVHRAYAVDLGLLVELSERFGVDSMAQVDLGVRRHSRQQLLALGIQATMVASMMLRTAGINQPDQVSLQQPGGLATTVSLGQLPSVASYRLLRRGADRRTDQCDSLLFAEPARRTSQSSPPPSSLGP